MAIHLLTQGDDNLVSQSGKQLTITDHIAYSGVQVKGQGNAYQNVQLLMSGGNLTWFVQYYRNGVRQKPPMTGNVVGGYPLDMSVWTPTSYYLITQDGKYLTTQLGERIRTQLIHPMTGMFVSGYGILGVVFDSDPAYTGLWLRSPLETVTPIWANHIITSHIGAMNFTHDDTGEVVNMIMPWYNWVYAMRKIGNSGVVAYGENGVVLLTPHGTNWGTKNITQVGIKGKLAVCTSQDDTEHYFVDEQGFFWHIKEGQPATRIDFSNYFNALSEDTKLSWDHKNDIIYICDGTDGYVWTKGGLGQGPADLSDIGVRWGENLFAVGPSSIAPSPFQICTDTIDFGCRTEKTISHVNIGMSSTKDVYAALDYRWGSKDSWITSPWVQVDDQGQAPFMISGVEFRIRVKLLEYEDVQMDWSSIQVLYDDLKPLGMGQ